MIIIAEIDPYLPIESFHDPIYAVNVADPRPCVLTIVRRIVSLEETRGDEFVEVAIDHLAYSDFSTILSTSTR